MPLGNLTSQFFANVYLDVLDQFVKHKLKVKYYIRYVDDFVILNYSKKVLTGFKKIIDEFLKENLEIELHPNKSYILRLDNGVGFLGFRLFYFHKMIKKSNMRKFEAKFRQLQSNYNAGVIDRAKAIESLGGWLAYLEHADTYKYRRHLIREFNEHFPFKQDTKIINNKQHKNYVRKVRISHHPYSSQKTLQLLKKGLSMKKIAEQRNIKESTVWEHLAMLVEYNQLSVWKILPKEKVVKILANIQNKDHNLKEIKRRINDNSISFDEINCVFAHYKKSKF